MTTKRLGLVTALLFACLAFALTYSRWSKGERDRAREHRAEMDRLRAQVAHLASAQEKATTALMLRDATMNARSAVASTSANPEGGERSHSTGRAPDPGVSLEEVIERQRRVNTERIAAIAVQLDQQLRTQAYDRAWDQRIRAEAASVVEGSESGRVQKVDCATNLCRILVAHESAEQQRQLGDRISGQPPFNEGDVLYQYDETTLTTALYKSRVGTTLVSMLSDER